MKTLEGPPNQWAQQKRATWRGRHHPPHLQSAEPSEAMFAATRRRLTVWYTGVLAALLLLSGILLYFSMQVALLGPIDGRLKGNADFLAGYWQRTGNQPCTLHLRANQQADNVVPYVACFDADGLYLSANSLAVPVSTFDAPTLAQTALASHSGDHTDTVNGGNGLSSIRRYALVVRSPEDSDSILGVVQVGLPVGDLINALGTLVILLLLVGIFTLGGSLLGGLYLSRRALSPTRLAVERQQAFTTDASHELRTPLTLLRADAETLLRTRAKMDPDDVFLLENIVSEASHMNQLVTNLLTLARLDAGTAVLKHGQVDLAAVAEVIVRRAQAYAQEKQVSLCLETVPAAIVLGDQALLEQLLLILLDNAIKYNRPAGTVTVRLTHSEKHVQLRVHDTGIGIPAKNLPHLGERFYRVDKARSREAGGAGLGLAIARSILAAHAGTLRFESIPEQGTTATLQLPSADTTRQTP
jgi:signal transduction histidine kinase